MKCRHDLFKNNIERSGDVHGKSLLHCADTSGFVSGSAQQGGARLNIPGGTGNDISFVAIQFHEQIIRCIERLCRADFCSCQNAMLRSWCSRENGVTLAAAVGQSALAGTTHSCLCYPHSTKVQINDRNDIALSSRR